MTELSPTAQKIWASKYAKNLGRETWDEGCFRVANYIAGAETDENKKLEYEKKFFQLINELVFLPGGRTLANAGSRISNLASCFVMPIEDNRFSIYETLKNSAEVFALGGGIGFNVSNIREEGALVRSTNGRASGPTSFLSLFDQTGEVISQSKRGGAQIAILDVDHPDILKFIDFKSKPNSRNKRLLLEYKRNLKQNNLNIDGDGYFRVLEKTLLDDQLSHFNLSVNLTDKFMNVLEKKGNWDLISRVNKETVKTILASNIIDAMAKECWSSGEPGLVFEDRVNEDNLVPYMGRLKASNPCISGDTKILTVYDGPQEIRKLTEDGKDILVYAWDSKTKLPVIRHMRNFRKTKENAELLEVEFDSGLKVKCTPDHNFYTFRGNKIQAKDLIIGKSIRAYSVSLHRDGHLRVFGYSNGKVKHQYVARMVWECLHGPVPKGMIIHHVDFNPVNNHDENFELLTHVDHNRAHYPYRVDHGFYKHPNHKVVAIRQLIEKEDVYNGTVDDTHTYIIADDKPVNGIYSGIVSANCSEIFMLPYEACCLGAINLSKFVTGDKDNPINLEFLEYTVRTAIRFLDDVQELSSTSIEEINKMIKGLRRVGLGILGWSNMLAKLKIPYDSQDAFNLGRYLSWFISFFAWLESIELAKEKGVFPFYDKDKVDLCVVEKVLNSEFNPNRFNMDEIRTIGVRNVSVTCLAPTGTTAILVDMNNSIEPFFALSYKRNITEGSGNMAKDSIIELNSLLLDELNELNLSEEELNTVLETVKKTGSISEVPNIPESVKSHFRTAHDISWQSHIFMQSSWQKYITGSVSKCVSKGTLIQTNKGIIPIENLGNARGNDIFGNPLDDLFVIDENGNSKKVISHYSGGNKPTLKIRTDTGFNLEATKNHRLMTDTGWKKLDELKIGDFVLNRIPQVNSNLTGGLPIEKEFLYHNGNGVNKLDFPEKMSVDFSKFLGMMCADGCVIETSGAVNLTTANDIVEKTFVDLAKKLFNVDVKIRIKSDSRTQNTRNICITSRPLVRMIGKLIGVGCRNKRIPEQILMGSQEEIKAFLSGVTLDGYVKNIGNNKTIPRKASLCVYDGYSELLANQIYMCLVGLGAVPYLRKKDVYYNKKFYGNAYGVFLFDNIIDPVEEHKKVLVSKRRLFVKSGLILPDINKESFLYKRLGELRQYTGIMCDSVCDKYKIEYDKNIFYSKITNIEESNSEVYDIEVEDTHSYLIGNLVSHNTINLQENATEQDIKDAIVLGWNEGLKGLTCYRNLSKSFQILETGSK